MKKLFSAFSYYMDVTLYSIRMAVLTIIEYPSNILGWMISNPIQFILGFATIKFVVTQFGSINGWDYGQLAFLYGISVISHALSMIFFIQGWFMGFFVIEGDFDRFLTRPMSVLYQFFFTNINIGGITDLIPGILVFGYGCAKTGFSFNLSNAIGILILLIGATLIRGGIYILLGSTSLWTKSANDFGQYTQEIFDKTTMYPLSIYPETMQLILTFLLPVGWVSFYPAASLLGIETAFSAGGMEVWITLCAGVLIMLIARFVFQTGLRNYESAGN